MKKKILYLITKSNWGGAQRYIFDMATNLDSKKYDVAVVLGAPRAGESGKGILLERLRQKKIRTIIIPELGRDIKLINEFKVFFKLMGILKEERPDVLHVNSSKGGGLGSLAGRLMRIKRIVFTVHGFAWNEPRPPSQKILIKFLSWLTLFFSHKNIFVVSRDYEVARTWPLVKKKLILVYNGIALSRVLSKENARALLLDTISKNSPENGSLPLESIWIGSITEFIKNKGVEHLLEGFAQLLNHGPLPPNAHLVLIGGGERENALRQQAQLLEIDSRVHFTGFIPNANHLLPAFDIFVISSLKEGLPYVLLEAGMANVPILATDVGEIPNILTQGETGLLIPPGDGDLIAQGLAAYISDIKTQEEIAKNFKQKISKEFGIETMIQKTVALY